MPQRPRQLVRALRTLVALALFAGCQSGSAPAGGSSEAPEGPAAFRPADQAAPSEAPEAAAPAATTHAITASVTRNDDGSVTLVTDVRPGAGYHLNIDPAFPWRVKVSESAPAAAGTTLGSADATTFTEDHASFAIPVTQPGGAGEIGGEVVIGVCDDEGCIRVREDLTWVVAER